MINYLEEYQIKEYIKQNKLSLETTCKIESSGEDVRSIETAMYEKPY